MIDPEKNIDLNLSTIRSEDVHEFVHNSNVLIMTENIQTSDLTIVATLGDTILLCVLNEDVENTNNPLAIQYNLGDNSFHIDQIQKFLKFTAFEPIDVHNERIQDFYRGWIYRKLTNETFVRSLVEFTPKEDERLPCQKFNNI